MYLRNIINYLIYDQLQYLCLLIYHNFKHEENQQIQVHKTINLHTHTHKFNTHKCIWNTRGDSRVFASNSKIFIQDENIRWSMQFMYTCTGLKITQYNNCTNDTEKLSNIKLFNVNNWKRNRTQYFQHRVKVNRRKYKFRQERPSYEWQT